ncbi:MAG: SLC13 family permease [Pseudomonadota bacterium]
MIESFISTIPNFHMYFTFAIILFAIVLFVSEKISLEISSLVIVLTLLLIFSLAPFHHPIHGKVDETIILSGFANPVLFTIISLLIIGQGLFHTGAVERPAQMIAKLSQFGIVIAFTVTLLTAGVISAFLNNTPVVVIFIPIVAAIAARLDKSPAHLLMPLSFITILGGMVTLIGSSSNLIVANLAEATGMPPIGFFDFSIPGLMLAGLGSLYVMFILPYIITPRQTMSSIQNISKQSGRQFLAQVTIDPQHPWVGATANAGMFPDLEKITVRLVQRGDQLILPPFEDVVIESGDHVIIAATRQVLADYIKKQKATLPQRQLDSLRKRLSNGEDANVQDTDSRAQLTMVEAVVSPGSRLIGRTIEQAAILADTGCAIYGLQRQSRMLRRPMHDITLEAGDVLLLLGSRHAIRSLRANRAMIMLEWSASDIPTTHHEKHAIFIFASTIFLAVSGFVPIVLAALAGAVGMIVMGCLNVRQASRAIDRRIYLLVGTAFALAEPLRITGGATFIADNVVSLFHGLGPAVILSAFFLITAILTNFLSNHATAALLAPIAVKTAQQVGVPTEAFVYGLIFALNCSFATPIAYQTNLIVMGPGHYQFRDYFYAGLPLIIIIWLAYSIFAPIYFGF